MESVPVIEDTHPEQEIQNFASCDSRHLPPNLVWRFALAIQHTLIRISSIQSSGKCAIAVYCPAKECPLVHTLSYIDFQRVLYHHLSGLHDTYIDHLGTFLVQKNQLLIEVHFASSDQIKRCIDGLDTMVLSKVFTHTFCSFVESFTEIEFDVNLVIQSNIESRLRLVTRENAVNAFSIVYTNKPALALFHVQNPDVYASVKRAYNQLLGAFPDFLGEVGAVNFPPDDNTSIQTNMDGSSSDLNSVSPHEVLDQIWHEEIATQRERKVHEILEVPDSTSHNTTSVDVHSVSTDENSLEQRGQTIVEKPHEALYRAGKGVDLKTNFTKATASSTINPQEDKGENNGLMTSCTPPHEVIERSTIAKSQDKAAQFVTKAVQVHHDSHGSSDTGRPLAQSDEKCDDTFICQKESTTTAVDSEMSEKELGLLADAIPPKLYKLFGIHLGLTENEIERIKSDNEGNSMNYILGILLQAYKKECASRHSLVIALLHCGLWSAARIVDPALNISALDKTPASNYHSTQSPCLKYIDGELHLSDRENLDKSISFWRKLHKEVSLAVSEALQHYGVPIHSTTEGSLIVHIKLSSYSQAKMLSGDIASGKLTAVIEGPLKALGFTGVLSIQFKIDKDEVTLLKCYEVYLQALLSTHSKTGQIQTDRWHTYISAKVSQTQADSHKEFGAFTSTTNLERSGVEATEMENMAPMTKSSLQSVNKSMEDIIAHGTVQELQAVISEGADVTQYHKGFLPIHTAAHCGKSDIIKVLAAKGVVVDAKTKTKQQVTALHLAAYSGHLRAVQTLVDLGADIEATSANGLTPLQLAAGQGSVLVTKFLLERGAKSNSHCKEKKTPLYDAITRGHKGVVNVLLQYGADVTNKAVDGETPIHHAIVIGNTEMLRMLVTANPQALSHPNVTTVEPPLVIACKLQNVGIIRVLLQIKADPNVHNCDNMTPLAVACSLENLEIMELLIRHGAEMMLSFPPYGTPLHIAASEGKLNATRKLLKMGMCPDALDSEGTTPLRRAVENRNVEIASLLLKQGSDIHITCPGDELPLLHKAAKRNDVKMLKVLIDNGADPYEKGIKGGTALFTAAANNSTNAIDYLCTYPGLVDIANKTKITPLMAAIYQRKYDGALSILKHKPNVSLCNMDGMTALYICVDFRAPENVVRGVLKCDATINSLAPNGNSPILLACHRGLAELVNVMLDENPDFFERFPGSSEDLVFTCIDAKSSSTLEAVLQHGANPNCIHSNVPMTPLHVVCSQTKTSTRMLQVILDHHPEVNIVTKAGAPLHIAVVNQRNQFVEMLLGNNANPNVVSGPEQTTPLFSCAEVGNVEAAHLLIKHGAKIEHALATNGFTALHQAAATNDIAMAQLLIDSGAVIDQPSQLGYTPLHIAISKGSQEVFAILIENNCNMNAQDNDGGTPLMRAIHDGKEELALTLLELGADIHICEGTGVHALHICARIGSVNIANRILDLGANLDTQDKRGVTPLLLAVVMGQLDMVKVLIKKGASVNLADILRNTPLHMAAENNNIETVSILLEHDADPTLQNVSGKAPNDLTKSKNIEKIILEAKQKALRNVPQTTSLKIEEVAYRLARVSHSSAVAAEFGMPENQWHNIECIESNNLQRMLAILNFWHQKKSAEFTQEDEIQAEIETILRKFNV